MKNSDLIKILRQYGDELEVTTSDKNGCFNDILSVELQKWKSKNNNHESVTLVIGGYDPRKTIVSKKNINVDQKVESDCENDGKFIDKVNNELDDYYAIDKEEALEAKKVFDSDILEMQKKYKEWFNEKYDKIAHDSLVELFGNDIQLIDKTLNELKLHVYENGWQDELDKDELNDKVCILHLLYGKLDEKVKEKVSNLDEKVREKLINNTNKLWNDIMTCGCCKDCKSCNKEDNTSGQFDIFNEFTK